MPGTSLPVGQSLPVPDRGTYVCPAQGRTPKKKTRGLASHPDM